MIFSRLVILKGRSLCRDGNTACSPQLSVLLTMLYLYSNMGLHDGMNSDGIMPNTKIAKAMGDVMGTSKKKDDK